MSVSIDPERCQGHGRCYDLAPEVFGADDEGYGVVLGDGTVPAGLRERARLAELNCPESAIELVESEARLR
jgi:ferredoxin